MKNKSETSECIIEFIKLISNQLDLKLKEFFSDNGGEFVNNVLSRFFSDMGIRHHTTTPYTPQTNGKAERKNRTLNDMAATMLNSTKAPVYLWPHALLYANLINNVLPTNDQNIPFENFFGKIFDYKRLKVFGSLAVLKKDRKPNKFSKKGEKGVFLGLEMPNKFVVYLPESRRLVASRNVYVFENERFTDPLSSEAVDNDDVWKMFDCSNDSPVVLESVQESSGSLEKQEPVKVVHESNQVEKDVVIPRRSSRVTKGVPPVRYQAKSALVTTYNQAVSGEDKELWKAAMTDEYGSMIEHNVFEEVDQDDHQFVSTKWIFSIKTDSNGVITRRKARIVGKGYSQQEGVDYFETFAPVSDRVIIRLFLTLACTRQWEVKQYDVCTAFLHADLEETVYVKPPYPYAEKNKLWRLNKALYGLKQSPRCWNVHLTKILRKFGLKQSTYENCFFQNSDYLVIVYVDDILISARTLEHFKTIEKVLISEIKLKLIGNPTKFLNINICRSSSTSFTLSQRHLILELANVHLGSTSTRKADKPLPSSVITSEVDLECNRPIRSLIGSLLYIAEWTRPDVAASVNILSRYLHRPSETVWNHAKQILRYLVTTAAYSLTLGIQSGRC